MPHDGSDWRDQVHGGRGPLDEAQLDRVLARARDEHWTEIAIVHHQTQVDTLEFAARRLNHVVRLRRPLQHVPTSLTQLQDLKTLNLTRINVGAEGARAIAQLQGLTTLHLSGNRIGVEGARAIAQLQGLTTLHLSGNRIGVEGARAIAQLHGLTTLHLGNNSVGAEGARAIAQLQGLTTLHLGNNSVGAEGARAIAQLQRLTTLLLNRNYVGDKGARAIAQLQGLTRLNLSGNNVGDEGAKAIAQLQRLTTLDLSGNSVGDEGAKAIAQLQRLTTLDLSGNSVGDEGARDVLDALSRRTTLRRLVLRHNNISVIPGELLDRGDAQAILAYWREHSRTTSTRLDEIKVLLLGEGENGKTHLRHRLFGDDPGYFKDDHEMTHNVVVVESSIDTTLEDKPATVKARVWDFGGQSNLHAHHRFFLARQRCLYLLVCDAKKTAAQNRVKTWLRTIRYHTRVGTASAPKATERDAPVLCVLTKCDEVDKKTIKALERDLKAAAKEAGVRIEGYHRLGWRQPADALNAADAKAKALERDNQLDALRNAIAKATPDVIGLVEQKFGPSALAVKRKLEDRLRGALSDGVGPIKYQPRAEYDALCREENLDEALDQAVLDSARSLGIVHFVDDQNCFHVPHEARDTLFNPAWVKGPIYTLLRAKGLHDRGVVVRDTLPQAMAPDAENSDKLTGDDDALWTRFPFTQDDRARVVGLLNAGELIFSVRRGGMDTGDWLVPDLLPDGSTPLGPLPAGAWTATVAFEYLPESVMLRLIGRWNDRLDDNEMARRDRATFIGADRSLRARVSVDTEECVATVSIWDTSGDHTRPSLPDAERLYHAAVDQLKEIAQSLGMHEQVIEDGKLSRREEAATVTPPDVASQTQPDAQHRTDASQGRPTDTWVAIRQVLTLFATVAVLVGLAWVITDDNGSFALLAGVFLLVLLPAIALVARMTGLLGEGPFAQLLDKITDKVPALKLPGSHRDTDAE